MIEQLPPNYASMSSEELIAVIGRCKKQLGSKLVILGHHYQSDEVIQFADFIGDSLRLSRTAAAQKDAEYIVFCGVHFMAESADILSSSEQIVCLPNMLAGCAMADMADDAAVESALKELTELAGGVKILPITYVNSTAATKAVTARFDGACCTSSNVAGVFRWALTEQAQGGGGAAKLLAVPDEHLARNTAVAMGYTLDDCAVYDPARPHGGLSADDVRRATFLLWKGRCYVHQMFRPEDVAAARAAQPGVKVIVHPECPYEVVRLADASGSTETIIRTVDASPPQSAWAIGTEANLVRRLARRHPDKRITVLADRPALCVQMARITLPYLAWVLEELSAGRVHNRVSVPPDIAAQARLALQRMIDIS